MSNRRPRVLDLFCGAGGLSKGFEDAGFETVCALDSDPISAETFRRNFSKARVVQDDIRAVPTSALARPGEIDVLIGGPSCQGFSTHGKRIAEDPRNFLFREFVRVAAELRPPCVVIENVKGLLHYDKGLFKQRIHEALEEHGYRVESRLLLAADFGVPQMRERLFFIATLTGSPIQFPRPTHGRGGNLQPWVTVREAISDLPPLGLGGAVHEVPYLTPPDSEYETTMRRGSTSILFHIARPVSSYALSIIRRIPQGKGIRHLPEAELPARFRQMRTISNGNLRQDCTTLYHRLHWDRPSYTITCYFRNVSSGPFVHPTDHRALSFREAARLQSFPDTFEFEGRAVARQIGNAVPPLLAEAVARSIRCNLDSTGQSRRIATGAGRPRVLSRA